MALYIKSPETEKLARKLAKATGETLTEAIRASLQQRLRRLREPKDRATRDKAMDEILARVHALPILDNRSEDEILGYDEHGIPR